jgi:protein CpxP
MTFTVLTFAQLAHVMAIRMRADEARAPRAAWLAAGTDGCLRFTSEVIAIALRLERLRSIPLTWVESARIYTCLQPSRTRATAAAYSASYVLDTCTMKGLNMNDNQSSDAASTAAPLSLVRRWTLFGVGATALAAGAFAAHRHAFARPMGFGGPGGPGGWYGGMDDADPAALAKRIEALVVFRLADIDATPEQRERIATILKAAANDLHGSRKQHLQARRESMQLLAAPTIDRARLEKLRIEQMQLGDSTSRRMLQAMMDSAEVLSPEQRTRLAERWQRPMTAR